MRNRKLTIKDICTFVGGSQPPKTEFIYEPKEGYIRLIQTRDRLNDDYATYIPEKCTKKLCEPSDILIGRYGPPIFQIFRGFMGAYNVALMKAVPKENIENDYLYYFLQQKSILKYVESMSLRTGGQTGVELDSLYEYPINLPDKDVQRKIITILKGLDDKIENNKKIIGELRNISKTIYDYWFLQFEFPNKDIKPYKSSDGKMIWNNDMEKEIPENWEVKQLDFLGEIVAGGTPSTVKDEYFCKDGIAWITPNDIAKRNTMYIAHGDTDITELGLKKSSAKIIPKGSILLTSRAPIGYISIASNEVCTNQGFKSIIPKKKFGTQFVFYTIISLIPYLKSLGSGSTFTEISKDVVSKVKVIIPKEDIIEKYNKTVDPYGNRIELLERENEELDSLRDYLLPLLMTGQVTFKNEEM